MKIFSTLNTSRFRLIVIMALVALAFFTLTRLGLGAWAVLAEQEFPAHPLQILGIGWIYDLAFYSYAALLPALYLALLPEKLWHSRVNAWWVQALIFASIYGLGFIAVAEFLFWEEFSVRFNFISVDYLIYRREVTDNIAQSYPLPWLLGGIFVFSLLVFWLIRPQILAALDARERFSSRVSWATALFALSGLAFTGVNQDLHHIDYNSYTNELASNGPYQFFAAFKNNELDYTRFYATLPDEEASRLLKQQVAESNSRFVNEGLFDIRRRIDNPGTEKHLNIMLVMIESLSARYLGVFGYKKKLTPNFDRLAQESLFFTQFYATGTRTTRGLEAVTLSIPPTPGRSIVKRVGRESGMVSLGGILKSKGYDVRFLYGGRGYFDNMNAFFAGNGYQVVDQSSVADEELHFTNAWGMSDEDLYTQAIKAADQAHNQGKPFFFHLMTTSNHRPYTYPEGRIDIPSGDGRAGAVKYTDWAIGDFLSRVKNKPWFENTLFVFVADHCAGSAGKVALPVKKYHIPLFIYAPRQLQPKKIDQLGSQIDLAPSLLALLNMDYESVFFGRNLFGADMKDRALIGNYQKLGLYQPGKLSILAPKKEMIMQINPESDHPQIEKLDTPNAMTRRNIAYYQGASVVYHQGLNRDLSAKE